MAVGQDRSMGMCGTKDQFKGHRPALLDKTVFSGLRKCVSPTNCIFFHLNGFDGHQWGWGWGGGAWVGGVG